MPDWDYSLAGLYFVTICTKNRKNWFGHIKNGVMGLNIIGCIANEEWENTEKLRINVKLDGFIIMPNHIHGIIVIENKNDVETPRRGVSTERNKHHNPQWQPNSLGSIINQFKGICTKRIRAIGYPHFHWQERFYDHLIRIDQESLEKIRYYIKYNPQMWDRDKNNLTIKN